MSDGTLKVAVAKYTIDAPDDFDAFACKQAQWLDEARQQGAQMAVLPEYLSLELGAMFDDATRGDLHASLAAIAGLVTAAGWTLFAQLARERQMHVVAGTFLLDLGRRPLPQPQLYLRSRRQPRLAGQAAPDRVREARPA